MTSALLDRVHVQDITRQAREIRPGRTLLTWVGALLFALGWLAYKLGAVLWLAGAWAYVGVREGWREARRTGMSRGAGRSD